jgi:DNA-binding MarR family transcriptional regulator
MLIVMSPRTHTPRKTETTRSWTIGEALFGLATAAVRSEPRDMSLTSLSTMATLEQSGPRRITDLAVVEGVMQPSMTVLVSGLERSGLVERRADAADRRVTLVTLTAAGADYIRARRQAGVAVLVHRIDDLPAHEGEALAAAIPALTHLAALEDERRNQITQSA